MSIVSILQKNIVPAISKFIIVPYLDTYTQLKEECKLAFLISQYDSEYKFHPTISLVFSLLSEPTKFYRMFLENGYDIIVILNPNKLENNITEYEFKPDIIKIANKLKPLMDCHNIGYNISCNENCYLCQNGMIEQKELMKRRETIIAARSIMQRY